MRDCLTKLKPLPTPGVVAGVFAMLAAASAAAGRPALGVRSRKVV